MHAHQHSIEGRIRQYYATIPKAERKLADLLLDFPGDVAAYSATELCQLAGVSKAAATRLFHRLGFKSFDEARRLARDTQNWGAPLYQQTSKPPEIHPATDRQPYLDDEIFGLQQTFDALDDGDIGDIVAALSSAKRLTMIGFRYNHVIAAYGHWQFLQFKTDVLLLPGPGQTLGEFTSTMGVGDVAVIAGFRRRTKGLAELMDVISQSGAEILYLTDRSAKKPPAFATWTIRCVTSGNYMFDSYAGPISVLRYLSLQTFAAMGKRAKNHLEKIERHHEHLAELSP